MTKNTDRSASEKLPSSLAAAKRDVAELHLLVAKGRERERERIAQELHDGALQALIGIKLDIEKIVSEVETQAPKAIASELTGVAAGIRDCVREIRAILSDLEPPELESVDITEALHRFIDAFRDRHAVQVRRHVEPIAVPLRPALKAGLFRILQEALNNVARHARATCVGVELRTTGGDIELRVSDNGRGFDLPRRRQHDSLHYGLRNMRSRAAALGGTATVQSSPGQGALVVARIPLEPGADSVE